MQMHPDVYSHIRDFSAQLKEQPTSDIMNAAFCKLLTCIWHTAFPIEPSEGNAIHDVTHHFIMFRSLRPDGSHSEASGVTGILSKLKYLMRLFNLYFIYDENRRLGRRISDLVKDIQCWFTDGEESPFNTVCTLQHLASSFARAEQSMPKIWWIRDDGTEMEWLGDSIKLDNIQEMIASMSREMVEHFQTKILLGKDIRVPYERLTEDMSNTTVGYSFLTDHRNPFIELNCRTLLLDTIHNDKHLLKRFTMLRNNKREWNIGALISWLHDYAILNLWSLVRCELLGGGPARGTELTAMIFKSTPLQKQRNLSFVNKHLVMIRTYSKTTAISGRDRFITHSCDSLYSDIKIQDLAIARPFAEIAASICFPSKPEIVDLYRTHVWVNYNRLFTTDNISDCIGQYTNNFIGVRLTVATLRHVWIAFRRKLCPKEAEFIEEDHEDAVGAEQAGHSLGIERRIYAVTAGGLMGHSEDVIPAFLESSAVLQKMFQVVPGNFTQYFVNVTY